MIDASHIKVHPHAAGARGGNHDMGRTRLQDTSRCGCARYAGQNAYSDRYRAWRSHTCRFIDEMDAEYFCQTRDMIATRWQIAFGRRDRSCRVKVAKVCALR